MRIQHLLDGSGDAGRVAADDELEAVAGYQRHVGGGRGGHVAVFVEGLLFGKGRLGTYLGSRY